jgi:hypothetical protein
MGFVGRNALVEMFPRLKLNEGSAFAEVGLESENEVGARLNYAV